MTATSHHCPNTTDRWRGCERADKRMGDGRTHSQIQGGGACYCPPLLHHQFQLTQMPATLPDHPVVFLFKICTLLYYLTYFNILLIKRYTGNKNMPYLYMRKEEKIAPNLYMRRE